eukprot:COSAG01_NODE_2025_length_8604_cov_16.296296_5_plen_135_part_00
MAVGATASMGWCRLATSSHHRVLRPIFDNSSSRLTPVDSGRRKADVFSCGAPSVLSWPCDALQRGYPDSGNVHVHGVAYENAGQPSGRRKQHHARTVLVEKPTVVALHAQHAQRSASAHTTTRTAQYRRAHAAA